MLNIFVLYKHILKRTSFTKIIKCNYLSISHFWIKLKIIMVIIIQYRVIKILIFIFYLYIFNLIHILGN